MDDPGPVALTIPILLLVLILVIEEFIYLIRAALNALSDTKAEQLLQSEKTAVRRLISRKDDVFLTMSFTSVLLTLTFATIAELAFGTRLRSVFEQSGMNGGLSLFLSCLIVILLSALVLMSIAGIVPRRIGKRKPVSVLTRFAGIALFLYYLNWPIVKVADGFSSLLMKLLGLERLKPEENVTEAEILSLVDAGEETGTIENDQRELIKNIFEFDDVYVSDLMTHRTDMTAIEAGANIAQLRELAQEEGYSRIPVYRDDLDDIVGVAYIKDLLKFIGTEVPPRVKVEDIMREAMFVPESMRCDKLFKSMNEKRVQLAVAVDEYGGTAGIITLEDLLESIFGSIQDEYDDEQESITQLDENRFTIDGTTDIEAVEELLGISIPEGDYDTLGGFLISLLGFIPEDGSVAQVDYENVHFIATEVEDRRIGKVLAEKRPVEAVSGSGDDAVRDR